jgi:hypothetical protein
MMGYIRFPNARCAVCDLPLRDVRWDFVGFFLCFSCKRVADGLLRAWSEKSPVEARDPQLRYYAAGAIIAMMKETSEGDDG